MKRTISLARAMRATALALCIASTAGICVAGLATGAVAQVADPVVTQVTTEPVVVPIDVGPTVVSILDIVWTAIVSLVGTVVAWAVVTLRPFLQTFLSAAVIDMAAKRVEAAARRGVEDVLGELRKRAEGGDFSLSVGSAQIANVVNYLLAQVPTWLRLAGMDRAAVERLVERMFGQEVASEAKLGAVLSTDAVVTPEALREVVADGIAKAVADPTNPLSIVTPSIVTPPTTGSSPTADLLPRSVL
jgi:hypothetical protein